MFMSPEFEEIVRTVFSEALSASEPHGHLTSLDQLRQIAAEKSGRAPAPAELIAALEQLEQERYVRLYKWCDIALRHKVFPSASLSHSTFFKGQFRVLLTPKGRNFLAMIHGSLAS
jgi:hypothetical protein